MTNDESWDITSDGELKRAVYGETQYDETQLPAADLDAQLKSAKRVLALDAGVTSFYDDRGIAVALLGITCAKAKGAVENSPVLVENIAGQDTRFRESNGDSLQLSQYEDMVQLGMAESEKTDKGTEEIRLTNTYLSDSSTR